MNSSVFKFLMPIAVIAFLLSSGCKTRSNKNNGYDISGKWIIYDATRNGRPTTTLKDGYISFTDDNILETNILGEVTASSFQYNGDQLVSSHPFEYDFTVVSISEDSLHINGKMRAFEMNFYLTRYTDSLNLEEGNLMYDTIELN